MRDQGIAPGRWPIRIGQVTLVIFVSLSKRCLRRIEAGTRGECAEPSRPCSKGAEGDEARDLLARGQVDGDRSSE